MTKRAYINYDAISSYEGVKGQVEIYYEDTDTYEWESYPTEDEMQKRVDEINKKDDDNKLASRCYND